MIGWDLDRVWVSEMSECARSEAESWDLREGSDHQMGEWNGNRFKV